MWSAPSILKHLLALAHTGLKLNNCIYTDAKASERILECCRRTGMRKTVWRQNWKQGQEKGHRHTLRQQPASSALWWELLISFHIIMRHLQSALICIWNLEQKLESFTMSIFDCHLLHQKVRQSISVMKTNTAVHWCFCCLRDKTWIKMPILWKHRVCLFSLLRFFDVIIDKSFLTL